MSPQELVLAYVTNLGVCLRALRSRVTSVTRQSPTQGLTGRSVTGERFRSGLIDGVGSFKFHGSGCRFELISGEEIDFDWDPEGHPVFDSWRLLCFAETSGLTFDQAELVLAAQELTDLGILLDAGSGWFRVRLERGDDT